MIRAAVESDVDAMVAIGELMHAESPRYSRLAFNRAKVAHTLRSLIASPDGLALVAELDGKLVGVALGFIEAEWFSDDRVAQELTLFVLPEYRGRTTAMRLLAAMDSWAEAAGMPYLQAGTTTGVKPELCAKLYEHLGFVRAAIGLEKSYT